MQYLLRALAACEMKRNYCQSTVLQHSNEDPVDMANRMSYVISLMTFECVCGLRGY